MIIKKFARLSNVTVEESTTLITAGNGKGKSTIVNAWCWLFTGKDVNGKDMDVKIYDDRLPSDQWECEVSHLFNGMEIIRKSSPVFATKRETGERYIKTRINTELIIDNETVTAAEWNQRLGITDKFLLTASPSYFFSLDWKEQRQIINTIAISKNPELSTFDLKKESEKVKQLKSKQKEIGKQQDEVQAVVDGIKDVEVPEILPELVQAHEVFENLKSFDNSDKIKAINERNNKAISERALNIGGLNTQIQLSESKLSEIESRVFVAKKEDDFLFVPEQTLSKVELKTLAQWKEEQRNSNFLDFPALNERLKKIDELKAINVTEFVKQNPAKCPLSNEACGTATIYAESSKQTSINREVELLINSNKTDLEKGYFEYQSTVNRHNSEVDELIENINKVKAKNEIINNHNKEIDKINEAELLKFNEKNETEKQQVLNRIYELKKELEAIPEFVPETLPTASELSEDVKEVERLYQEALRAKTKAEGVNENNVVRRTEENLRLSELRKRFAEHYKLIAEKQKEIDSYLEKLKKCLFDCFPGKLKIEFEFYEYTIDGDPKETFRIFVDGKEFQNTALKLHAGVQLVSGFCMVFNPSHITFVDNAECTSNIEPAMLNLIELRFVEGKELTII